MFNDEHRDVGIFLSFFFLPILKLNGVSTETCFIAIAETLKCCFFLLKNDIINLTKHLQRIEDTPTETERSIWLLISNKRSYQFSVLERRTERRRRCPAHAYTQVPFTMSVISCFSIFFFFYKKDK